MTQLKFLADNLILIKLESTYGVDAAPTAADALLVNQLTYPQMMGEVLDRNLVRPFMGGSSQLVVGEHYAFSFNCEVAGAGVASVAPGYGAAIQSCRNALTSVGATPGPASHTYTPISAFGSGQTSASIHYYIGGVRHVITGFRGSHSFNLTNNAFGVHTFQGMGIYAGPTDTATPTFSYSNYNRQANPQPVTLGNTLNINIAGFSAAVLQSFQFTQANEVTYDQLPGGAKQVLITSSRSTFEAVIQCPSIAQRDYWSAALNDTTNAVTITQGNASGFRMAFSAPAGKTLIPSYSDDRGKLMLTVPGIFNPVNGNDEYAIRFD